METLGVKGFTQNHLKTMAKCLGVDFGKPISSSFPLEVRQNSLVCEGLPEKIRCKYLMDCGFMLMTEKSRGNKPELQGKNIYYLTHEGIEFFEGLYVKLYGSL